MPRANERHCDVCQRNNVTTTQVWILGRMNRACAGCLEKRP